MRIGFDAKRAFANNTGLGNYSRFIIKSLLANFPDHHYFLYTPFLKEHKDLTGIWENPNVQPKLPPEILSALGLKSLWRSWGVAAQGNIDKIDIFHGLSNELPFGKKKFKKVVTVHDLLFYRYPHLYKKVDVAIYKNKWKYACKEADKIIAISNQTKKDLIEFLNVPPEKIEVIYQGCNDIFKREFMSQRLDEVSLKYNLPPNFILNVGTIEARKNALAIVKALATLKDTTDIPLVIVGRPTPYKEEIVRFAIKEDLKERVIFLHTVSFEDLPLLYKLSRLFIYPSIFEGFGIPIIEAMNTGVPVISSTGSCFSEAGGPDTLYADPHSTSELAKAITLVLENPAKAQHMIAKGKEFVRKFENDKIANDIMSFYNSL